MIANVDPDRRIPHEPRAEFEADRRDQDSARGWCRIRQRLSNRLSWTHYRALLAVSDPAARAFYEIEAERENWSTPHLERRSSRRSTYVCSRAGTRRA
ncbi:MAG: hypothetical protein KIT84_17075 [Labilithrix sp.]|nr:hypothetical protein [Labilithrix sp.]MCW5812743.1 hypothetical protein [Labilithrix sp.]